MSYGIAVWDLTHQALINNDFIIQKKILKVVTFSDMTIHSDPIFSKLQLLKVDDIFQLQLLSSMYDCYHELAPSYVHILLQLLICITITLVQPLTVVCLCKKEHIYLWY